MFSRRRIALGIAMAALLSAASFGRAADPPQAKLPFGSKDTIVSIRFKTVDAVVKGLSEIAVALDPQMGPMIGMQANQALTQFPGLDRNGAVAILILDPKKYEDDRLVGVVTVKDPKAFKEGVHGPDHVLVMGALGVIGDNEAAVGQVAQYIKAGGIRAIPTLDMSDTIVVNTDLAGLVGRYRAEIDAGLQVLKLKFGGGMPGMDEAQPNPATMSGLKAIGYASKLVQAVAEQGGPVEFGLSISATRITVRLAAEAKAGSDLAAFLGKLNRPADLRLAEYLPKESSQTSLLSFDAPAAAEMYVGLVRILYDIGGADAAESKAVCEAIADAAKNLTGLSASAEVPGKGGDNGVSLEGIKDADTARASTKALLALIQKGSLGALLDKYGVRIALSQKHRTYENIPVDRTEIQVDVDKLVAALPPMEAGAKEALKKAVKTGLRTAMGHEDKLVFETAYGKALAVTTYGPEGTEVMDRQIDLLRGRGPGGIGGVAEYKAALAQHPATSFMLSHTSLFAQIGSVAQMMKRTMLDAGPAAAGGADMFPTRAELPAQEKPITASSRVEGNRILCQVFIPVKPIKDFVEVFKKKMMEQMMRNMQPPAGGAAPMPPAP